MTQTSVFGLALLTGHKLMCFHANLYPDKLCSSSCLSPIFNTIHAFVVLLHMQMIDKSLYPAPGGVSGILLNSLI